MRVQENMAKHLGLWSQDSDVRGSVLSAHCGRSHCR